MIDKILIALIILLSLIFLFTTPDRGQSDIWGAFKNSNLPVAESTLYRVEDPSGTDIRVYEWKTKSNDTCVMAFSTNGGVGLDCL